MKFPFDRVVLLQEWEQLGPKDDGNSWLGYCWPQVGPWYVYRTRTAYGPRRSIVHHPCLPA